MTTEELVRGTRELSVCPKCLEAKKLTRHHLYPKRFFGDGPILLLCTDCHRELEKHIPRKRRLKKSEYLEITKAWMEGEMILVQDSYYLRRA